MHFTTYNAAAVLALVICVQATNLAIVKNHCSSPVYLWSVGDSPTSMITLPSHGLPYVEEFQTREAGGRVIKIAADLGDSQNVSQFEYTYSPGSTVWYDISNINGHPFQEGGIHLMPSIATQESCNPLMCHPGAQPCVDAYNTSDDIDTHACPAGIDLTMVLCPSTPTQSKPRDAAPEAAPESAPEAALAPAAHAHAHGKQHLHSHQRRTRRGTIGLRV